MTKIIGLTGGIGSGKTMVANYFKSLGIPVYIADDEAKELMKSAEVLCSIKMEFGNSVFEDDQLNTKALAQVVFNTPEKLQKLNAIVHPIVKEHFEKWLLQYQEYPFIIKESAILFESGSDKDCYAIITVTAPLEIRINRVIKRDHTDRKSVLKRIENQWSDEAKVAKSDYLIQNIDCKKTKILVDEILKKLQNI